jgi:hypothetical protein
MPVINQLFANVQHFDVPRMHLKVSLFWGVEPSLGSNQRPGQTVMSQNGNKRNHLVSLNSYQLPLWSLARLYSTNLDLLRSQENPHPN